MGLRWNPTLLIPSLRLLPKSHVWRNWCDIKQLPSNGTKLPELLGDRSPLLQKSLSSFPCETQEVGL